MKIKLLILFILTIQVLAADAVLLQTLYDHKKYQDVIDQSERSYSEYNDPNLHLLWAKSAEALGDDISAMSAYERVLIIMPDNTEAQIALIHLYKRLNRGNLSQELRATLIQQELSPSSRAALAIAYDSFNQRLNLRAQLTLGYDSNIGANSDLKLTEDTYDETIDTLFTRINAQLNYTQYLSSHWFWQTDLQFYAQNNSDASFYNLYDGAGSIGIGYKEDTFTLVVPITYARMYYFERDFLQQYGSNPYLNLTLSHNTILNFNLKYLQRRFIDPVDYSRDDDILGVGAGVFWYFDRGFSYIKIGYDTYEAQRSEALYFTDKQLFNADVGVSRTVDNLFFSAGYHFEYCTFDDTFESGLAQEEERTDVYHRINLKTGMEINDYWSINLEYNYTNNNSTYQYADYDKHVVMTNLQYSY